MRNAIFRLVCRLKAAWLNLLIWELSGYLATCEADGLKDSLKLRDFRIQLAGYCERHAQLLEQAGTISPSKVRHAR